FAFFVNRQEPVELDDRTSRAEQITRTCAYVDRSLIQQGRHHLRRDESLPDQLVQRKLVFAQEARERIRRAQRRRRSDRFVGVLRIFLRAIKNGLLGQVISSELIRDEVAHFSKR